MNTCLSVLLMWIGCIVQFVHDNKPLVYVMQEDATVEEIQRCIGSMDYAYPSELSRRLVVEARGEAPIDALWKVQSAIGRLGGWRYAVHEKDGNRFVELSGYRADGYFGTIVYVEVEDNKIVYRDKEMTPETFRDLVVSAVKRKGFPVRIYLLCLANTVRDMLDAAELLGVDSLNADLNYRLELLMADEEQKWAFGNWGNLDKISEFTIPFEIDNR